MLPDALRRGLARLGIAAREAPEDATRTLGTAERDEEPPSVIVPITQPRRDLALLPPVRRVVRPVAARRVAEDRLGGGVPVVRGPVERPCPTWLAQAVYQRAIVSIAAAATVEVVRVSVPFGLVFFWEGVGSTQQLTTTYSYFVDDAEFSLISGAAVPGTALDPYRFPSSVIARRNVFLRIRNNAVGAVEYDSLLEGHFEPEEYAPAVTR